MEKIWVYVSILAQINMSFLFHKKGRKVMANVWKVIALLVAISMILLYAPGLLQLFTN